MTRKKLILIWCVFYFNSLFCCSYPAFVPISKLLCEWKMWTIWHGSCFINRSTFWSSINSIYTHTRIYASCNIRAQRKPFFFFISSYFGFKHTEQEFHEKNNIEKKRKMKRNQIDWCVFVLRPPAWFVVHMLRTQRKKKNNIKDEKNLNELMRIPILKVCTRNNQVTHRDCVQTHTHRIFHEYISSFMLERIIFFLLPIVLDACMIP